MDDELKFWFRFCLLMTILFISLFTTITICDCVRTINFTKNNYCEVTVPGNQSLAWQKCK